MPELLHVPEHAEYKRATIGEGQEAYNVGKFGRIIGITWEALVNDDLDAFSRVPMMFQRTVTTLESNMLVAPFIANNPMSDSNALFSTEHKNLMTASALSVASLSEAVKLLRRQRNDQNEYLDLIPKFLIVGTAQEAQALRVVADISPAKTDDVNPNAGKMQVIVDPRLDDISDTVWFISSDPAQLPCLEIAHLAGEEGPSLTERVGFDVDGIEFKCRHVVGVGVVDHRGFD